MARHGMAKAMRGEARRCEEMLGDARRCEAKANFKKGECHETKGKGFTENTNHADGRPVWLQGEI